MLREAVGDLNRMRQILQVLVKHGFGDLLDRARIFQRLGLGKPAQPSAGTSPGSQRLARVLCELGPTFIKMGQLLSTRPDLVPEPYASALRPLQDSAPPIPAADLRRVLERELGAAPEAVFARFDPEPIASASIAQVHRAAGADGRELAVKVKRPGIERTVRADLDILYYLAHLLEAVVEESSLWDPVGVVREFDRAIGLEMDLQREAENLQAFAKKFAARGKLIVPEPVAGLCTRELLSMTFIEGVHLDAVESGSEMARKAARNLIEGSYQQIFEDGLFHADPHPGNLRFFPDGRVGLLDFGQVGRLSTGMRSTLVLLGLGVVLREPDTVARLVYRIGVQRHRVDLGELKADIERMLESTLHRTLGEVNTGQLLKRLIDLSVQHDVRIPAEYVLISKALGTIDGTIRRLDPGLDVAEATAPYVQRLLLDRFNPDDLRGGLLRSLLLVSNFLDEVPRQVSQILLDMEGGRLSINVRDPESARLRSSVRGLGIEIFWGLVAAGLLAGSLPAFMGEGPAPTAAIAGLAAAGLIALTATARYFLTPMLRKLRLRPWLERRWGSSPPACEPQALPAQRASEDRETEDSR
ncbi:MAG: AarF/ABC1/UbiB kinase family protein [Deltaproteobacteria bacterium]|nr:AarF/ABC1/UbiB kinase family protein [Deltaproteobacteria bacterium]